MVIKMAHYAFLNSENIVTEVIVGKDETDLTENWEQFYGDIRGQVCKRTSYNTQLGVHQLNGTPFRKNYAGIGYTYDADRDAFIPPKPEGEGWLLEEATCMWRNAALEAELAEREAVRQQMNIGVTRV